MKKYQINRGFEHISEISGLNKFHSDDVLFVIVILSFSRLYLEADDIGKKLQYFIELKVISVDLDFHIENPWVDYLD